MCPTVQRSDGPGLYARQMLKYPDSVKSYNAMVVASYCVAVLDEKGVSTLERVAFDSFVETQSFAGTKLRAGYFVSVYPFSRDSSDLKS